MAKIILVHGSGHRAASWEKTVSCLGACGLAPTLTVNDEVHPKMTPEKAVDLLEELRGEKA